MSEEFPLITVILVILGVTSSPFWIPLVIAFSIYTFRRTYEILSSISCTPLAKQISLLMRKDPDGWEIDNSGYKHKESSMHISRDFRVAGIQLDKGDIWRLKREINKLIAVQAERNYHKYSIEQARRLVQG